MYLTIFGAIGEDLVIAIFWPNWPKPPHTSMWVSQDSPSHSDCSSSFLKSLIHSITASPALRLVGFTWACRCYCLYCSTGFSSPSLCLRSPKHIRATTAGLRSSHARTQEQCAPGCLSLVIFLTLMGVSLSAGMVSVDCWRYTELVNDQLLGDHPFHDTLWFPQIMTFQKLMCRMCEMWIALGLFGDSTVRRVGVAKKKKKNTLLSALSASGWTTFFLRVEISPPSQLLPPEKNIFSFSKLSSFWNF